MIDISQYAFWLVGIFVVINIGSFIVVLLDKLNSQNKNARRVSEGALFCMATFFGSSGVLIGMFVSRHKTQKWYFLVSIPFLVVQNIAFLWVLFFLVRGECIF